MGLLVRVQGREAQARKYKEAARGLKARLGEAQAEAKQNQVGNRVVHVGVCVCVLGQVSVRVWAGVSGGVCLCVCVCVHGIRKRLD